MAPFLLLQLAFRSNLLRALGDSKGGLLMSDSTKVSSFFRITPILMAVTIVLGFSMQLAMGRSSFSARPLVHIHAIIFMGWVALFVIQSRLAASGSKALHRKLGQIGAGLSALLVILGFWITIDVVQRGLTPFFFQPQHFLIANPLTVLVFAALTAAAIRFRRHPDWHMRLHICALAGIMGPAFGRLLPMPFLIPYAFEIAVIFGLIFPAAGMIRDWRTEGRIHQAWWSGVVPILLILLAATFLAQSSLGNAAYRAVTEGHPGSRLPGLDFPPPPAL